MFQFIWKFTYTDLVLKALTNKATEKIYIKFYDFCRNLTTLTSFANIQVFNFADFIFICVFKTESRVKFSLFDINNA